MAPKRVVASSSRPQKSFLSTVYDEATNPENASIVRSLLVFGVCVEPISAHLLRIKTNPSILGRRRFPPQQPRRAPPPSVSRSSFRPRIKKQLLIPSQYVKHLMRDLCSPGSTYFSDDHEGEVSEGTTGSASWRSMLESLCIIVYWNGCMIGLGMLSPALCYEYQG